MITPAKTNIPTGVGTVIQCGPVVELDIDALIEQSGGDVKVIASAIKDFYETHQFESTLSLVLIPRDDGMWCIFEGTCNPKMHRFKVVQHITTFPANRDNPRRPPTVAVNFICAAGVARSLPIWIP